MPATGPVPLSCLLQIERLGGTIIEKKIETLSSDSLEDREASQHPFSLGKTRHEENMSFSTTTLVQDVLSSLTKNGKSYIYPRTAIQYVKNNFFKPDQVFESFLPSFLLSKSPNMPTRKIRYKIRLAVRGNLIDILPNAKVRQMGHQSAGGDMNVPLQHGFIVIGDITPLQDTKPTLYLLMNINSTSESLTVCVFDPFCDSNMKTTSAKVRLGEVQMRFYNFEEFLLNLENFERVQAGHVASSVVLPGSVPFSPMDELLAAVISEHDATTVPTQGTHSPLRSEPTFVDLEVAKQTLKRSLESSDTTLPPLKIAKTNKEQQPSPQPTSIPSLELVLRDPNETKLHSIQLHSVRINSISYWKFASGYLNKFVNLRSLKITNSKLARFPEGLQNLSSLVYLHITESRLTGIPIIPNPENPSDIHITALPTSLQYLNLSGNRLTGFLPSYLPAIRYIDLGSNRLISIANCFDTMPELSYLNLFGNQLKEIPSTLSSCLKLNQLHLSCNGLTSFSTNFFNSFSELMTLDLSRNNITTIGSISNLANLQNLDISYNPFEFLPGGLHSLRNLQVLRFFGCSISDCSPIPDHVEVLSMGNNPIPLFPPHVFTLRWLRELDFQHNPVGTLSPHIGSLVHLQVLNLRNTGLVSLPNEIKKLEDLVELNISGNKFTNFPDVLVSLTSLRSLDISYNHFVRIFFPIGNLTNLLNLDMSHNQLQELPSLHGLQLLTQLDISNNQLTTSHTGLFALPHLHFLYSANNNFKSEYRKKIQRRFTMK